MGFPGGQKPGGGADRQKKKEEQKKRKFDPATRVGRRRRKGLPAVARIPKGALPLSVNAMDTRSI